jgi:shikimate kinase/3-dehydroquinate synthase
MVIEVPPGQQHKTLTVAQSICEQLIEKGFDRSGTIIGLGGSVISGLAGFVAAVYMRGVDLVHCPTSLLAMVDTSIGGKAGINLPQGKNLVGAFKQPTAVIADVATLQSLSPEEFSSGMAEVIKHSLIDDAALFAQIESGSWAREAGTLVPPLADLQALVAQAIQVKIRIVQEDPFDQGRRNVLNLGHTFAHAIEQVCEHTIRHGEAVAMGLVAAANLSARLGHCSPSLQDRLGPVLADAGLPNRIPAHIDLPGVYQAMRRDKKAASGRIRFVLFRAIGDVFLTDAGNPRRCWQHWRTSRNRRSANAPLPCGPGGSLAAPRALPFQGPHDLEHHIHGRFDAGPHPECLSALVDQHPEAGNGLAAFFHSATCSSFVRAGL